MMIAVHHARWGGPSATGRGYAADRLAAALGRSEGHVRGVRVFLADDNGPKGGADKTCTVTVALDRGSPVTVVERAATLTAAVDGAAHRAGHTVQRVLAKRAGAQRRLKGLARRLAELLLRKRGGR